MEAGSDAWCFLDRQTPDCDFMIGTSNAAYRKVDDCPIFPYDVTFAFAFRAFRPESPIHKETAAGPKN
jgi:hypothetical protein